MKQRVSSPTPQPSFDPDAFMEKRAAAPAQASSPTRGGEALSRGVKPSLVEARKKAVQGLIQKATPVTDFLGAGEVKQMGEGLKPFLAPGPSTFDEKVGGALDIGLGALSMYGKGGLAKLGDAAITRGASILKDAPTLAKGAKGLVKEGWRDLAVPAIKAGVGASAGGFIGSGAAAFVPEDMPQTKRALKTGGAVAGGMLGGTRLKRDAEGNITGLTLATGEKKPSYQDAPRTERIVQIIRPKNQQVPDVHRRVETGVSEILRDNPDMADGTFPLDRPGSTLVNIAERIGNTEKRIWNQDITPVVQPLIDQGATVRPTQTLARVLEKLPQDVYEGTPRFESVGPDISKDIAELQSGKSMPLSRLMENIARWGNEVRPLYRKSIEGARESAMSDSDLQIRKAMLDGAREDLYARLSMENPKIAEYLKTAMGNWGAVRTVRNGVENRFAEGVQEVPASTLGRIGHGLLAAAKVTKGINPTWALPSAAKAISPEKTTAVELLEAFQQFAKSPLTPGLGAVPAALAPPSPLIRDPKTGEARYRLALPAPSNVKPPEFSSSPVPPLSRVGFMEPPSAVPRVSTGKNMQVSPISTQKQLPAPPAPYAPPVWQDGGTVSPDVVSQYALRNGLTFSEALKALQGPMPPPTARTR